MKRLLLTTSLCVFGTASAYAGGLAAPVMEMDPVVIEQTTAASSSSAGLIIPLILIALIAVALSSKDEGPMAISDARLKTDILRAGTAPNGLPLYRFRYAGKPEVYEGVMAQDVLNHTPGAAIMTPTGYYKVNYAKLGLEMRRLH